MAVKDYFSLVKFSHTIFALPFALVGYFLAVHDPRYSFGWRTLLLVLFCMVFARSAAMAFNRWQDRDIDLSNPRTVIREIPSGLISSRNALIFVIMNSLFFIITTYFINGLCFMLSPIALFVILGYSYTKRFTALCHLVLGVGLSLAPIGAYLSVTGTFDLVPVLYGLAVMLWVAGFDIIYALQDEDFDKSLRLKSIPVKFGKKNALGISMLLHGATTAVMLYAAIILSNHYPDANFYHWVGLGIFVALLAYQHSLVTANDLSKVNLAFFTTNGIASVIFGSLLIMDMYY